MPWSSSVFANLNTTGGSLYGIFQGREGGVLFQKEFLGLGEDGQPKWEDGMHDPHRGNRSFSVACSALLLLSRVRIGYVV